MMVGSTLYITGQVQPGRYDATRVQLSIGDIQYLGDVKDNLIQKITIHLNVELLTDDMVMQLGEILTKESGNVSVEIVFRNSDGSTLAMKPAELKVRATRQLMDFLQTHEGIEYTVND